MNPVCSKVPRKEFTKCERMRSMVKIVLQEAEFKGLYNRTALLSNLCLHTEPATSLTQKYSAKNIMHFDKML